MRCLVLLVDFADNTASRTLGELQELLFSQRTHPTGSLRDYYRDNSYGQLDLDGDVIGWLRLPNPYVYYVDDQGGQGTYPQNVQGLVADALRLAQAQVDFSRFDANGDGYLDGLVVVHAGGGGETEPDLTNGKRKIWSHQGNLHRRFVARGVSAYAYCLLPEDGTVGVCCHEVGHMLGLPDLYPPEPQSDGMGVGRWCLMGMGGWNGDGHTPAQLCAWAKGLLGWLTPTTLQGGQTLQVSPAEQQGSSTYRVWTGGRPHAEYFLLENRQRIGFDRELPASGLLIWHVNDTRPDNRQSSRPRVALEQADGQQGLEQGDDDGDDGDPFPGAGGNTTFDDASTPSSRDQVGRPTAVSVANIATSGTVISCEVRM